MALTALLFAHHGAGPDGEPAAMWTVAGLSLIERQVCQARALGAERIVVIVERMPPGLAATLARLPVEIARAGDRPAFDQAEPVLVIEDALLIDHRLLQAVLAKGSGVIGVWKGRTGPEGSQRIDPATHWAGVAFYPGALVARVLDDLCDWDLQETLLRAAFTGEKPLRVDAASVEAYAPDRSRAVPMLWVPIRTEAGSIVANNAYLASLRDGCPTAVRKLCQPVEGYIVRRVLATRLTAKQIAIVSGGIGLASLAALCAGLVPFGLVLALVGGLLSNVRATVAQALHEPDDLATIGARLLKYGSYLAIAGRVAIDHEWPGPWLLAAVIILASLAAHSFADLYRRFAGRALWDAGTTERRLRLLGSDRDTNLLLLVLFAAFDALYLGLGFVASFATATAVLTYACLVDRLTAFAGEHSNLADQHLGLIRRLGSRWLRSK